MSNSFFHSNKNEQLFFHGNKSEQLFFHGNKSEQLFFSMAMMMKQPWMCRIEAPVQLRQLRRSSKENDCEENVSDEDEQIICETLFSELLSM